MQISETNGAKGTSERSGATFYHEFLHAEPFRGYSETHSVFFSSDNKYTVLGIVSVTTSMIVIFPLRIFVDWWLWKRCFSGETGSTAQQMCVSSMCSKRLAAGDSLPAEDPQRRGPHCCQRFLDSEGFFFPFEAKAAFWNWHLPCGQQGSWEGGG